jgi:hypothetical protein
MRALADTCLASSPNGSLSLALSVGRLSLSHSHSALPLSPSVPPLSQESHEMALSLLSLLSLSPLSSAPFLYLSSLLSVSLLFSLRIPPSLHLIPPMHPSLPFLHAH